MPSHYNCCVPLCMNHKWKNQNFSFYRIPKDVQLNEEYRRLIRNKTLKLQSSHTQICSSHFEGGKKRNRNHLPFIFPWSKPINVRKPPVRRSLKMEVAGTFPQSSTFDHHIEDVTVIIGETATKTSSTECATVCSNKITCAESKGTQPWNTAQETGEYVKSLQDQLSALRSDIQNREFSIKRFQNDDNGIAFYTGFPNFETLLACYELVVDKAKNISYGKYDRKQFNTSVVESPGASRLLSLLDEFFLVLLRLRLGLLERDLADRFGVSKSTISRIFTSWIRLLREESEPLMVWPSKEEILHHMPAAFKAKYPDVVVIIDCTEIKMECPSGLENQSPCYSYYKSNTTMKGLVGTTPSGVCSFVSDLYPGSISDKEIVKKSGFLDKLM